MRRLKLFWKETFLIIRMWSAVIMRMAMSIMVIAATAAESAGTAAAESDMD